MFDLEYSEQELALIEEYFERNQRKKGDEDWLKAFRPQVINIMDRLGKSRYDFGNYRVSVTVPKSTNFNEEKVLKYLESVGLLDRATKVVLDEEKFMGLVAEGLIDIEKLKETAWEEKFGSPRLTINRLE